MAKLGIECTICISVEESGHNGEMVCTVSGAMVYRSVIVHWINFLYFRRANSLQENVMGFLVRIDIFSGGNIAYTQLSGSISFFSLLKTVIIQLLFNLCRNLSAVQLIKRVLHWSSANSSTSMGGKTG